MPTTSRTCGIGPRQRRIGWLAGSPVTCAWDRVPPARLSNRETAGAAVAGEAGSGYWSTTRRRRRASTTGIDLAAQVGLGYNCEKPSIKADPAADSSLTVNHKPRFASAMAEILDPLGLGFEVVAEKGGAVPALVPQLSGGARQLRAPRTFPSLPPLQTRCDFF